MERVTYSPGEFAALFGKSQTWGYRQIYAGKVETITEYGRIQIPASEVEKILKSAGRYEGMPKKFPQTKEKIGELKPQLKIAWREFIQRKRASGKAEGIGGAKPKSSNGNSQLRKSALERLRGLKRKSR